MDNAAERDDAVLASLGIRVGLSDVDAACAQIARRIHGERLRVVGFVPANPRVAVPPVLVQLGLALCSLTGATVAVVDANVRYPGLALANGRAAHESGDAAEPLTRGDAADPLTRGFTTRWLRGSLALLSPPHVERAGDVAPQLARMLHTSADLFAHVLVDLTGFELLGEHAAAASSMDAVALVGKARHSREQELIELAAAMPHGRLLGVLLVG